MSAGWLYLWNSTNEASPFIMAVSFILLLGMTAAMTFFAICSARPRCPGGKEDLTPGRVSGSRALEILWTAIPVLLVLAIFWIGINGKEFP